MVAVLEPVRETAPAELDEVGRVLMEGAKLVRESWWDGNPSTWMPGMFCAVQATQNACHRLGLPRGLDCEADVRLAASLGVQFASEWNDAPGRTAEEVAMAMERAAIHA